VRARAQLCLDFELKDQGDVCQRTVNIGLRFNTTKTYIMDKALDLRPPGHTCTTAEELSANAPGITQACGDQVQVRPRRARCRMPECHAWGAGACHRAHLPLPCGRFGQVCVGFFNAAGTNTLKLDMDSAAGCPTLALQNCRHGCVRVRVRMCVPGQGAGGG